MEKSVRGLCSARPDHTQKPGVRRAGGLSGGHVGRPCRVPPVLPGGWLCHGFLPAHGRSGTRNAPLRGALPVSVGLIGQKPHVDGQQALLGGWDRWWEGGMDRALRPLPLLCVLSPWFSLVWLRSSQDSGCPGQNQVGGVPAEARLEGPGGPAAVRLLECP